MERTFAELQNLVHSMSNGEQLQRARSALAAWKDAANEFNRTFERRMFARRYEYLGDRSPFSYSYEEFELERERFYYHSRMLEFETTIRACAIMSDLGEIDDYLED